MADLRKKLARNERYGAAPGARYNDSEAQVIGAEVERMRAERVPVVPGALVARARPEGAPLHPFFDWDDRAAAEKWRKEQAGSLLRHLQVVYAAEGGGAERRVKAEYSVVYAADAQEAEEEREYVSVSEARRSPPLRDQILRQAVREFKSWAAKYEEFGLAELQEVFEAAAFLEK